jgi:archaellum component FlaF (FlaF/FlaG flagellin family)
VVDVVKKRGVSGIVAAVILFTLLFTVGTGYLIAINQINKMYVNTYIKSSEQAQERLKENLEPVAMLVNGKLSILAINRGGLPLSIIAIMVRDAEGVVVRYYNVSSTTITPRLPIFLNPLDTESITTDIEPKSLQKYEIKLLTDRGNVFSATYPPVKNELAARALSSGALGDLYLEFGLYSYYRVSSNTLYYQGPAFTIPVSFITNYYSAFSVTITNLNSAQKNIILDGYTRIFQFWGTDQGVVRRATWYIVSNQSSTILSSYTPIELEYDRPKTIVFASKTPNTFTPQKLSGDETPSAGTLVGVLILTHGWIGIPYDQIENTTPNYGQNSPYVTTLYRG